MNILLQIFGTKIPLLFLKIMWEKYIFLNFDGINWKADIFINGNKIGK
jgi:hypothetical protein